LAVGIWFPDLRGRISAGLFWKNIPPPRSLTELKADPEVASDLRRFMVALIPLPAICGNMLRNKIPKDFVERGSTSLP
jgi:hypothetical protein